MTSPAQAKALHDRDNHIKELNKRRGLVEAKLTRLQTYLHKVKNEEVVNVLDIEARLEKLEELWKEFEPFQASLEMSFDDDDANSKAVESHRTWFEDTFYEVKSGLKGLIQTGHNHDSISNKSSDANSTQESPSPDSTHGTATIKLPKLELPTFDGNYSNWISFQDLFTAIIHTNDRLSGAQKLQYLKTCLKGEASKILSNTTITNENYQPSWDSLNERFNNKRYLVKAQLKNLFKLQSLQTESADGIRKLLDDAQETIQALKILDQPIGEWDAILIHILTEKLDKESKRLWELQLSDVFPNFDEFKTFLSTRFKSLEASATQGPRTSVTPGIRPPSGRPMYTHYAEGKTQYKCILCTSNEHFASFCPKLKSAPPGDRSDLVRKHRLCFKCLRPNHVVTSCPSTRNCSKCGGKHHIMLCKARDLQKSNESKLPTTIVAHSTGNCDNSNFVAPSTKIGANLAEVGAGSTALTAQYVNFDKTINQQILLGTALCSTFDANGREIQVRALLDSGSMSSFITMDLYKRLKIPKYKSTTTIFGIGGTTLSKPIGLVNLEIRSCHENRTIQLSSMIIEKITGELPTTSFDSTFDWINIQGLELADPTFNTKSRIDLLLGADVFFDILLPEKRSGHNGAPDAIKTKLGWVLCGPIDVPSKPQQNGSYSHHACLQFDLKKFWQIEEMESKSLLTNEEIKCEEHFKDTHTRNSSGRYVVKLPLDEDSLELGNSRETALKRYINIERRFQRDPQIYEVYHKFMKEYLEMKHMELIPDSEMKKADNQLYYFPHHVVVKPESTTTKYRVVFDGSCKSSTGIALNEKMLVGPTIQQELIQILMRFRVHKVALTADIAKMYRQILIHPSHEDFQRIFWRFSLNEPIQEYRLKTVTYGTASAPYLATKCLQQLALDEGQNFPLASKVAQNDFYVDDLLSGASDTAAALKLQTELIELCKSGGFPLRKWSSNDPQLLESLPEDYRETKIPLSIDDDSTIKALGLQWNPAQDTFSFKVNLKSDAEIITKRLILSEVARLFDPLGWLAPVIIIAKILLQKLWLLELTWDQQLPQDIIEHWLNFKSQLPTLELLKINRWISLNGSNIKYELYGFADASESAYAAVVYLCSINGQDDKSINLIASKTRVCPLKQISLPRLELSAALLLAKLLRKVQNSLNLKIENTYAWSDSTIVLSWIAKPPRTWTTFVANRVAEIQDLIAPEQWIHVKSADNPADLASRGIMPKCLISSDLWWNGPTWLLGSSSFERKIEENPKALAEQRKQKVSVLTSTTEEFDLLSKYSTLNKLQRVTAYILRFINNCKRSTKTKSLGPLSSLELQNSCLILVKLTQSESFSKEIESLKSGKELSKKSNILPLNPFLDNCGILRVGGRLRHSNLPHDKKHPMLLPKKSTFTKLLINHEHLKHLHGGTQLILAVLQRKFWIINARQVVSNVIRKCVTCFRQRASVSQQQMGNLPIHRMEPARAFLRTGLDYGGPFTIKLSNTRGAKKSKAYICLFVCMVTKAIHLELVSDLTSDAFIAALKRFVSRRGLCSDIYSDNGTNFVGANNELKELLRFTQLRAHNADVSSFLSTKGIQWHFIPPSAPHMGGLWEAGIKSTKKHLIRIIGNQTLTFEEFTAILTQVEACLNSRPLCPISSNPDDLQVLTPGHFLIGEPLTAVPEPDLTELKVNRLSRWQLIQQLLQHFWKRWSDEYLQQLQSRNKWTSTSNNVKIGDMVLIKEDNTPPLKWKLARIIEIHPGKDNLTRAVTLKTIDGDYKRPIVKLALLPTNFD